MEKLIILVNTHYLLFFKRYTWRIIILENADNKQSNFATELKSFDKDMKQHLKKVIFE